MGVVAAVAAVLMLAPGAAAADRSGTAAPETPFTWEGASAVGHNEGYDGAAAEPCGKTAADYCDETLVNADAGDFYDTSGGGVEFSISGYDVPDSDFDLYVYESDASGALGDFVGSSAGGAGEEENLAVADASGYYLVRVVYWDVDPASGYDGRAEFFRRAKVPADIDDPLGLQDFLASDPFLGFRSHSEPHIAQSPVDPNILVAASKMYNRDRDSLGEYEFKIGTYVSFNRGRTWDDLGQLDGCPPSQAPPESWPNNTCYPNENPNRGGTGPEDADDDRGQGDFGEEYITSDVWVDFDERGNAYAMVLDSPPFPSGAGWGMSFHRWRTPSARDLRRGRTWGDRIPINAYETQEEQEQFLDDKNTFAVNNAPGGGRTGIMVACWGQNGPQLADRGPQQIVCERSTDGGRSWPDEPVGVSPGEQRLVIGVHVVADTRDPNTFYAVWLEYLSGLLDGTGTNTYYLSKSTDGGQSWSEATPVQTIMPLPQIFPRQSFRNLSLPIMAVGPNSELYLTYADYNPAPRPGDEDGMQADVKLTVSYDGGTTWSGAEKVNRDRTNADQFQQYIRVTPSGQLNVSFFDRRLDRPDPPNHPGNFFIDAWLARSADDGATWRETRVSHDSWDPSINPPISGSGQFIGDYQGLVADDCFAIPFVNDTHLANDPARDPDFDGGHPRSRFQEVFSWLVPNTRRYGGGNRDCRTDAHTLADEGRSARAQGAVAASAARRARRSERVLETAADARAKQLAAEHQIITEANGKTGR
ncbi:MAG: exo-alpha-sialidase [Thermoleophilaceae bacterium]|nr:exo-alpha-sialidase [Thermoleophilaceae bacterium]